MNTATPLFNDIEANGVSMQAVISGSKHTVHVVASGSPNATLTIRGLDGLGNSTVIDTKEYSAAAAEDIFFEGSWNAIEAEISSYVAGTFNVTLTSAI